MPPSFDYPRGTQAWKAIAPILGAVPVVEGRAPPAAWRRRAVHARPAQRRRHAGDRAGGMDPRTAQVQASSFGPKYDVAATPFLDYHVGPARQAMWVLFGAVGVLLLIACANVSGLMLTRVSLRNRDDAVRVAIGGTRGGDRAAVGRRNGVADGDRRRARPADVPMADRHDHRPGARGHPADGRSRDRLDRCRFQHPDDGDRDAVVRGGADSPCRRRRTWSSRSTTAAARSRAGDPYRTRSSLLVVQIGLAVVLLVAAGLVVQSFNALQRSISASRARRCCG